MKYTEELTSYLLIPTAHQVPLQILLANVIDNYRRELDGAYLESFKDFLKARIAEAEFLYDILEHADRIIRVQKVPVPETKTENGENPRKDVW